MGNVNESKVPKSEATVLLCEVARGSAGAAISSSAITRHFDGSNYAFVDGHVKWLKGTVPVVDRGGAPTFFVP